jgi:uncharacterized membrane protein YbhN (UPF0104 family)
VAVMRRALEALRRRRRLLVALEVGAAAVLVLALAAAVHGAWKDAGNRIEDARPVYLAFAVAWLVVYYLVFVVGWMWILAAWGIRLPYRHALQAEMASMLAKYIPGGVWTPAARVVVLRRAGITDTPLVLSSVLLEAGLSAVAGVFVFLAGMPLVSGADSELVPVIAFGLVVLVLLHPAVFRRLARIVFKPFGGHEPPRLPVRTMVGLLLYYCFTWIVGGVALYFLLRSVGGSPDLDSIPFLGGTSAVGAIVAVLAVIAPSGLGVREASMYGLLVAVVPAGAALGALVLNRLAITVVEGGLLLLGGLLFRLVGERRELSPER